MILLYLVEGLVPVLTFLLVWAGWAAWKKDIARHKKIAASHAVATWASTAVVAILVQMGYTTGKKAPEWILEIHLVIIYLIPLLLVILMFTGLSGKRKIHLPLALFYAVNWVAALVTGGMIFASVRGWM